MSFGAEEWQHAVVDRKLLRGRKAQATRRFISKSEFARRFAIWKPTMARLIEAGAVVTTEMQTREGIRTVVDLHLSQIPEHSSGTVHVRDAAEYLGLPVSVLQALRERGVFATKHRYGRGASWHKEDVEAFLRAAFALPVEGTAAAESISLKQVMQLKLRDDNAKADIVAAMFDGRLAVVGKTGKSLEGLQLDRQALHAFVGRKRVDVEGNSYSFPQAAAESGLDQSTILDAIRLGMLDTVRYGSRTRIPAASLGQFQRRYVPLAVLAKRLGTSSRALTRVCSECAFSLVRLRRRKSPAPQLILPRELEPRLLDVWEALRVPKVVKGADNTHIYERALCTYLDHLRQAGSRLPREGKNPNKRAIATACGFHRTVLTSFPSVVAMLTAFDEAERRQMGWAGLRPIEALRAYLDDLRVCGKPLPMGKHGRPNRLAIAKACGFDRNCFYEDASLAAVLDRYAAEEADLANPASSPLAA